MLWICLLFLTILRYLHANKLTGEIPETIGQLASLKDLILHSNELSGQIPSTIGQLIALQDVYVCPLGEAMRLNFLCFAHRHLAINKLSGSIPSTIGQLTTMIDLYIVMLTDSSVSQLTMLYMQASLQQPTNRTDSLDDRTIDGSHCVVSRVLTNPSRSSSAT